MPGMLPLAGLAAAPFTGGASLLATALPSLIEGGIGLLGGFFSGKEKEKEREQTLEDWQTKRNIIGSSLKPEYSRYSPEKDYGTFDNVLKRLLLGGLSESFGGDRANDWGIDFSSLLSGLGAPQNPTYTPNPSWGGTPAPGGASYGRSGGRGGSLANAEDIMRKYGMEGRERQRY